MAYSDPPNNITVYEKTIYKRLYKHNKDNGLSCGINIKLICISTW
jgi:hypothetical protein